MPLRAEVWQSNRRKVRAVLDAGTRLSTLFDEYDEVLQPDVWDLDLAKVRQDLEHLRAQVVALPISRVQAGREGDTRSVPRESAEGTGIPA